MNEYLEKRTYRIITISPIHIQGSDGSSDYGQAFFRRKGDTDFIYLVDTVKLQKYLYEHHGGLEGVEQFAEWLTESIENNKKEGINAFLKDIKFDDSKFLEISKGKVYAKPKPKNERDQYFIRNGMDRAYIPGSSVKGAIRTAVLWKILKTIKEKDSNLFTQKMTDFIDKGIREYSEQGTSKHKYKETFASNITDDIFQAFDLGEVKDHKDQKIESDSPFTDLFRCLKIKDSDEIENKLLHYDSCRVLSFNFEKQPYSKFPNKIETCFIHDKAVPVTFDIVLDRQLLEKFKNSPRMKTSRWNDVLIPFDNTDDVIKIVSDFSDAIWNYLSGFYAPFLRSQTPISKSTMQCGEVAKYFSEKGFGFIRYGQNDIFFHIKSVKESHIATIQKGDKVKFMIGKGDRPKADNVIVDNTILIASGGLNINTLIDFYKTKSSNEFPKMKLGWGTGLLGTTIAMLLQDNVDLHDRLVELRDKVITYDGKPHGNDVPKSARIICNEKGEPEYPLGWIRLIKQ